MDFGGWSSWQVITIIICITAIGLSKKGRGIKNRIGIYWKIKM